MIKTIIFDYDGTIHQTLGIYEPAFRETYQWLTEQKVAEEQKIASSKIAGCLYGYGDQGELDGADYLAEHVGDIPELCHLV